MSRLIDADKIDFNEVFVGASEFAQDTRNAAQMLIDNQPTAYDVEAVVEQLKQLKMRHFLTITGDADKDCAYKNIANTIDRVIEIIKGGGVE